MSDVAPPAPTERGWGKLLLALAAFLFLPHYFPLLRALLPVEDTLLLLLPAIAACCLVGWWAGGRLWLALLWLGVAIAILSRPGSPGSFYNLERGWCLLLAGAFGLISLFGVHRPFFNRALTAAGLTLALVLGMSLRGPFTPTRARAALEAEFKQRHTSTMSFVRTYVRENAQAKQTADVAPLLDEMDKGLRATSEGAIGLAPSLLLLQSLLALALAWTTYHRIARTRLGPPLGPLKDFRFNDQLVWGLIAGLAIVFVPGLDFMNDVGRNLLLFFGALYAIRGLGVLSWFMSPGAFTTTLVVGFFMLWWPVLNAVAFTLLALAAFGLGLGDTWADWRRRARPTT